MALPRAQALGVSCRPEIDADRPFLLALYATTRADELAMTDWPDATKAMFVLQQFSAQHRDYVQSRPGLWRLVVQRDGAAAGRLYIDQTGASCHLVDISLMPELRNQGIGAALLNDLMAYAAGLAKDVTLSVIGTNPAKALYVRLGFQTTDTASYYHSMSWTPPAG